MNLLSKIIAVFVLTSILLISACRKHNEDDKPDSSIELAYPSYFPDPHYRSLNNPLSKEGIELGRKLFYDPILSIDSSISCGTCHSQAHAFSGHNTAFSLGVNNKKGSRNSPALFNLAWNTSFMADGGINHIEVMPVAPITNPVEMGETVSRVIEKLQRSLTYTILFERAFGPGKINDQKMLYAMSQFMSTIVSADSRYDQFVQGRLTFTVDEKQGLLLFRTYCESCHKEPLFTDYSFRNNGIDSIFKDRGRELITLDINDRGKFKVPSLRNIAYTYPYMHDGRYYTLENVLDQYRAVKPSHSLDPTLKKKILLSDMEKKQIIAFLKTLTDNTYLSNRNYSEPK